MNPLRKYPRTPHLPWSPGATDDDERVADVSQFIGRQVVVTEKMDGECTTIHSRGCHARSTDSGPHPSRSWVRALAGQISHVLPETVRIVGENLYAEHSIKYSKLPSYFLVFGVHAEDRCESWDETTTVCAWEKLKHVPVLYEGLWDEKVVRSCYTGHSRCGGEQEGYVVRLADKFSLDDFATSVAKFVRADHVQTDEHWMTRPVVPNGLASTEPA